MKIRLIFRSTFVVPIDKPFADDSFHTIDVDIPVTGTIGWTENKGSITREYLPNLIGGEWLEGEDGKSSYFDHTPESKNDR